MRGKNTIQMNTATLIECVQCYLYTQFQKGKCPTVTGVRGGSGGGVGDRGFIIEVADPADIEPADTDSEGD